jgi:hypothetical protein
MVTKATEKEVALKVTVSPDTAVGLYALYVQTPEGLTNARPFCVDAMPELEEAKDHARVEKAQAVPNSAVVTGTATAEAGDFYKVSLKPNETLAVEVLARRLGSPMDPAVFVYDAKTLRELPALYADDTLGLQGDCRTVLQFPNGGDYILEVRDMTYRGGADYAYRLRLGRFPSATTAFPLALTANPKPATVLFTAADTQQTLPATVVATDAACVWANPMVEGGQPGWPLPVKLVPYPTAVEQEPNNTRDTATKIPVPGGVSAGFGQKSDVDVFSFPVTKGTTYTVEATAAEHGAPTEVLLTVLAADGKTLATSDPQKPTARVEFTATTEGLLSVKAEQTNYLFGPKEVYFLSVRPNLPDFELTLARDRLDVPGAGRGALIVQGVTRLNGFKGPVEVLVNGEAVGTVPETATFPYALPVSAKAGIATVAARADINGVKVTRGVKCLESTKAVFGTLAYPPMDWATGLAVAVLPRDRIYMVEEKPLTLNAGETAKFKLTRSSPAKTPVTVTLIGLPTGTTAKPATFPANATEYVVELTAKAGAVAAYTRPTLRVVDEGASSVLAGPVVEVKGKPEPKPDPKPKKK